MTALAARPLDDPRFALADRIARRVRDQALVDPATRDAVSLLTASADPERAERLAVHPGEVGAMVERLAVWALHRASDEAVARAGQILDDEVRTTASIPGAHARAASASVAAGATGGAEVSLRPAGC